MTDLTMTYYERPNGKTLEVPVNNIRPEDKAFFLENDIKLSAEDDSINDGFILYGDDGTVLEDGTPDEIIVITRGRDCETSMAELAYLIKARKGEKS